jgi:vacuolar-type H+-ATPase subunit C/Vma6
MGAYYHLACLLPPLPVELGEKLSLTMGETIGVVKRNIQCGDESLLEAQLLSIDVANWEQIDQDRDIFTDERGIRRPYIYDSLWNRYYTYFYELAQKLKCRFVLDYLPWEIELRNNLVSLRAKESGKDAEAYAVLGNFSAADFTNMMAQIKGKKNPLLAERYLDTERLKHIFHCQGNNPFSIDAILAYVLQLTIYSRWESIEAPYEFYDFLYKGG